MGTVEVSFTPLPANVRTARLIATSVARRTGVAESLLGEVRLAVGEACSRAVDEHREHCPHEPIRLEMRDDGGLFEAVVTDAVPGGDVGGMESLPARGDDGRAPEVLPPGVSLAVVAGLADDVEITTTSAGVRVRMAWPAKAGR